MAKNVKITNFKRINNSFSFFLKEILVIRESQLENFIDLKGSTMSNLPEIVFQRLVDVVSCGPKAALNEVIDSQNESSSRLERVVSWFLTGLR